MWARVTSAILIAGFAALAAAQDGHGRWVDLTHELSSESIFWPTAERFELTVDAKGMTEGGYYYSAFSFCTAEHGGTHIDAPVHFAETGQSVDQIPLTRLIGDAFVVDVAHKVDKDRDYLISTDDLATWEKRHGKLPAGAIVLFRTGFGRYWPDAERYLGTAERGAGAVPKLHFPGLHHDAAAWLATERRVSSVGIDTASIDYGQSQFFRTHVTLMKADIPAFENVANLERLPPTGAFVVALPAKIKGGSGGPLRIIARLPSDG